MNHACHHSSLGLRLYEWIFVGLFSRGFPGRKECSLFASIHNLVGFSKFIPLDLKLQDIPLGGFLGWASPFVVFCGDAKFVLCSSFHWETDVSFQTVKTFNEFPPSSYRFSSLEGSDFSGPAELQMLLDLRMPSAVSLLCQSQSADLNLVVGRCCGLEYPLSLEKKDHYLK